MTRAGLGGPEGPDGPVLLSLAEGAAFARAVAERLGVSLAPCEERGFEDGEFKLRPLVPVRGREVFLLQSLDGGPSGDVAGRLVRALFLVGALKDADAAAVTVVAPYLCFLRKDQQTKPRDPVTVRYLARLFEAVGVDRVVTVEPHNPAAFQNAFRCRIETLHARGLLAEHAAGLVGERAVAVVSPDPGGAKRAELFRQRLEQRLRRPVGKGICDKHRSGGVVTGDLFAGDVDGREAVIVDDMIATGGTLARAAAACKAHGATRVHALATHGLFAGGGAALLDGGAIDTVTVTNTVATPPVAEAVRARLTVLDTAGLIAAAITRCHAGGSIVDLLESYPTEDAAIAR